MKDQNQSTNIVPSRNGPHWSSCLVTMLIPAAMKAAPVKYAQNKPPRQPSRHQAGDNAENEEMVNTETTDEAPKRYGPNPVNLSNTLSHRREPEPPAGRVPAKVRAEPHIGRVSKKTVRVPTLIGFALPWIPQEAAQRAGTEFLTELPSTALGRGPRCSDQLREEGSR